MLLNTIDRFEGQWGTLHCSPMHIINWYQMGYGLLILKLIKIWNNVDIFVFLMCFFTIYQIAMEYVEMLYNAYIRVDLFMPWLVNSHKNRKKLKNGFGGAAIPCPIFFHVNGKLSPKRKIPTGTSINISETAGRLQVWKLIDCLNQLLEN